MIKKAFTMAEILLSLTIIGVVAAITLPSLTGNINEKTWNTQKAALYARFSQAIALMPSLNSYGIQANSSDTKEKAALAFVTDGLSKVLKINNVCDKAHLTDCGLNSKITTLAGSKMDLPTTFYSLNVAGMSYSGNVSALASYLIDSDAAAFETVNGESVLAFYNPYCTGKGVTFDGTFTPTSGDPWPGVFVKQQVCVNFVYDLNGTKGPNQIGKDMGYITAFYPTDSEVVAAIPAKIMSAKYKWTDASQACRDANEEWNIPNMNEALSLYINNDLNGKRNNSSLTSDMWTSSSIDVDTAWYQGNQYGMRYSRPKETELYVVCIKR